MNLAGKLIQLKIILFYLDINNSDQFWHPVGCSTLQIIVSAKMRGSIRNVSESAMLYNYGKNCSFSFLSWKVLTGCCPEAALTLLCLFLLSDFLEVPAKQIFICKHNFFSVYSCVYKIQSWSQ